MMKSLVEYLFFLDADIGFNHKNFERLIEFNKDLSCGVYPKKGLTGKIKNIG